ncbi:MAG: FtsX-like permease family protein [bacterium]|nr:FtsX-like permease family protein [bacterium]
MKNVYPSRGSNTRPGDFGEIYNEIRGERTFITAWFWYWYQVFVCIYLRIINATYWSIAMIKNYLKITIRTLLKNKVFSSINITGISLSIAICLIIIIYIRDWRSADQFHVNNDRIYRIYTTDTTFGWDMDGWATTPAYLVPHLLEDYPYIEDAVRLRRMGLSVLHNSTAIDIGGFYAEPSFFNIFDFHLKDGDPNTALNNPFSIVLSEEYALTFFGDEDPIGKTLTVENRGNFTVTGILNNVDEKTHINFKSLVSFSTINSYITGGIFEDELNDWEYMNRYYTYILINDTDNISRFSQQLPEIENVIIPEDKIERNGFDLENICDINLGKNMSFATPGTKSKVDLIFVPFLAVTIVFLVCFNYIILSIARSLKRSKEIGLRKVIGSKRSQIIKLFLCEAFVITFLALITACIIILCLIPLFNNMDMIENAGEQINLEMMKDPGIYIDFILIAIAISLFAGLYPALYLSAIQPLNALQGSSRIKGFSHLMTRKILMGIQFAVSLISIIFIFYFNQMFGFMKSYDRNVAFDNCVNVYLGEVNYETFRNEISKNTMFTGVSFSEAIPLYGGWNFMNMKTEDMAEPLRAFSFNIDIEFMENFKLKLIAGRNFSREFTTDAGKAVIVNEKTVEALGFDSPEKIIGKVLSVGSNNPDVRVIGVVKDFTHRIYLENPIIPTILVHWPAGFRYANIRYLPEKEAEVKTSLTEIWNDLDKVHPGRFSFSNEVLKTYEMFNTGIVKIFTWVTGLIVLIALFGLLGITAYTTELRVKEIGIRKVLGASSRGLIYLLSKSYIKLVIITCVIGLPIGYILSDLTIQALYVAIRPSLSFWILPLAMLLILMLTFITTGSLTQKAANANPVNTLRDE